MTLSNEIEEAILLSRYRIINKVLNILDKVLIQVSLQEETVVICNVINEMSLDLIYNGASPKSHLITSRTKTAGILGGYILRQEGNNSPSKRIIFSNNECDYSFYTYKDSIIPTTKPQDKLLCIEALTDEDGYFLTSDLDILVLASNSTIDKTPVSQSYGLGSILKYEHDVACVINNLFTNAIKVENNNLKRPFIPLVKHGPFNRYPKSKLDDIYFPVVAYHPLEGKLLIGSSKERETSISEFLGSLNRFSMQGYNVDIHKNWIS